MDGICNCMDVVQDADMHYEHDWKNVGHEDDLKEEWYEEEDVNVKNHMVRMTRNVYEERMQWKEKGGDR